jgi:hypothetical protein
MKKLIEDICRNPKYFTDKLTGRSKISCADYSYFNNNGNAVKIMYKLIEALGNKYRGGR